MTAWAHAGLKELLCNGLIKDSMTGALRTIRLQRNHSYCYISRHSGDIVVFKVCIALTSLNLWKCYELTGKAPKKSLPIRHTSLDVSQQNSHGRHCV